MRFSLVARVAISALCSASFGASFAACSAGSSGSGGFSGAGGALLADAGADGADAGPMVSSIVFVPNETLTLAPKATQTLTVAVRPAGNYRVSFALLGSGSDAAVGDAALDSSEVDTDDSGNAHVLLTAPSSPATFNVRASVGVQAQARLSVSVSARNYTTLRVVPSYAGKRPAPIWTATLSTGITCADLVGNPPPDGALAKSAPDGQNIEIAVVPVGVDLAVTVRAGHYIGGCANQSALSEADGNTISVFASDRPINFGATQLDLSFGPSDPNSALSKLLNATVIQAEAALSGGAASDVTALLDAMRDGTALANRDDFSAARTAHSWDAALSTALGDGATTRLRAPAGRWLSAGLATFYGAGTFVGQLGPTTKGALFALSSVAQVPAANAGFPSSFPATWSADSSDTLLLGTELSWVPSRLVTALAALAAAQELPASQSVEAALAQSVDCALVGNTLVAYGSVMGSAAYDGCNEACSVSACQAAITALWKKASDASGSTSARLTVTGTGPAQLGDDASLTSLSGSWVGLLQVGSDSAPASGPLNAHASAAVH